MSNVFRLIMITSIFIGFSGCTTMTIEGDVPKTPQSKTGTETVHGSYYDFVWESPMVLKCDNRQGLARARYHTNALYSLVSVVSLGLYVPQTVQWWCDGSPSDDNSLEVYHPGQ